MQIVLLDEALQDEWHRMASRNRTGRLSASCSRSRSISDPDYSLDENRYLTTGYSNRQRLIIVSHTERDDRVRIISARSVTPAESRDYEQEPK